MTEPALKLVHDICVEIIGDKPPLIEPGKYELIYYKRWIGYLFGGKPKALFFFRVVTMGPAFGKKLFRCYNLKSVNLKRGDFSVGWRSDFAHEYTNLFDQPPDKHRISMTPFKSCVIKGKIRTVEKDYKNRPIHESRKYSVIGELISVEAGEPNL